MDMATLSLTTFCVTIVMTQASPIAWVHFFSRALQSLLRSATFPFIFCFKSTTNGGAYTLRDNDLLWRIQQCLWYNGLLRMITVHCSYWLAFPAWFSILMPFQFQFFFKFFFHFRILFISDSFLKSAMSISSPFTIPLTKMHVFKFHFGFHHSFAYISFHFSLEFLDFTTLLMKFQFLPLDSNVD